LSGLSVLGDRGGKSLKTRGSSCEPRVMRCSSTFNRYVYVCTSYGSRFKK